MTQAVKVDVAGSKTAYIKKKGNSENLGPIIASLKELDLEGLRHRWRKRFRAAAPEHLPRWLLFRILAYRVQADALGDLDRETIRFLEQVADDRERRRTAGEIGSSKKPPPVPPVLAKRGRLIFQRYIQVGCLTKTLRDLRTREILTKRTFRKDGSTRGGIPFGKGSLHYLLRNRVYIGEIIHKENHYPGEHEPIVDRVLFDSVQEALTAQSHARRNARLTNAFLLTGRIFDDRGNRMSPNTAQKGGVRYRYYVSSVLAEGRKEEAGSVARVPAPEIEATAVAALREKCPGIIASLGDNISDHQIVERGIAKVVLRPDLLEIITCEFEGKPSESITVPSSLTATARKRQIIFATDHDAERPIRSETRARLVEAIAKGRYWLDELVSGKVASTVAISARERCSDRSVRMNLSRAFLSPTLVAAAVEGTLPPRLGLAHLVDLPAEWLQQIEMINTR